MKLTPEKLLLAVLSFGAGALAAQLLLPGKSKKQEDKQEDKQQDTNTHVNDVPLLTIERLKSNRMVKAGHIRDLRISTSLPFTLLQNSYQTISFARVFESNSIAKQIFSVLENREIDGLDGVTFSDIIDMIFDKGGSRVYIYGGFLRDLFRGKISDDIDFLFKSKQGNLITYLRATAEARNWEHYLKQDEKTNETRTDFISIGRRDAKEKFSGHPIGVGCEGDFTCNTLMFDLKTGSVIDPTGRGVHDAVDSVLRIPFQDWDTWLISDRLIGMKLIRFVNFMSRGFVPSDARTQKWVIETLVEKVRSKEMDRTVRVFLKRKVFKKDLQKSLRREFAFRKSFVRVYDAVFGEGGSHAYLELIVPFYWDVLKERNVNGLEDLIRNALAP